LTAEQLEAARSERMRQNGHGAIAIEDVRTWIEETGLAIFLPRSAQAGFTAPTFVEAVAGERTTEPTLELIASSEALLVRLEAEGVAVRLNLAGQPGDQPDYVVASWVLPYIYALRGDRDWRRSPQLTGSRQVSPLAVQVAKHLDTANLTALQLRDALGRETSETAVLRALHELWKQLRVIPVVPEVGKPAAWQPLRQRFQKAIAEGASTSQVTAISVLASIYLQAVIAASMEDVELFLAPLTSRSKIREVVRGLAATRQVHSTTTGHAPLYYVAGTLPDFPAVPSYQATTQQPSYRSSSYRTPSYTPAYLDEYLDGDHEPEGQPARLTHAGNGHANQPHTNQVQNHRQPELEVPVAADEADLIVELAAEAVLEKHAEPVVRRPAAPVAAKPASHPAPHRPRPATTANTAHPRNRAAAGAGEERRRTPAQRNGTSRSNGASHSNGARPIGARSNSGSSGGSNGRGSFSNGNGHHANGNGHVTNSHGSNGQNRPQQAGAAKNGAQKSSNPAWGKPASGAKSANGARPAGHVENRGENRSKPHAGPHTVSGNGNGRLHPSNGTKPGNGARPNGHSAAPARPGVKPMAKAGSSSTARPLSRPASRPRPAEAGKRKPATASASKRYSFAGQAKQAPKAGGKHLSSSKPASRSASSRPATSHQAAASSKRRG
jgi:23S rRNA pseudouridine2605 synthase